MFEVTNLKRTIFFVLIDSLIIYIAIYISFLLRFDFTIPDNYINDMYLSASVLIVLKVIIFYSTSIYTISWRHFSFKDTVVIVYFSILVSLCLIIFIYIFRDTIFAGFPRSIIPIEFFISIFLILSIRISKRFFLEIFNKNALGIPTLVVASTKDASQIIRQMQQNSKYWPVAIYDDDNFGTKINGVNTKTLSQIKEYHDGIDLAIVSNTFELDIVYNKLEILNIKEYKIYNNSASFESNIKDMTVQDLLARHPKDLDKKLISSFIGDKIVMITGAGGSIGSEIARQCVGFGAKKLILVDHGEFNLYSISQELESSNIASVMQSVVDKKKFEKTFDKYRPQIVIHAAAYKHVPLVEENIEEAIVNNIIGTKNSIDLAIKYEAEKFVLISTDKAVRPTNVMGTTKRVCELYVQNVISNSTDIVAVRFGNVLGSSGSVIPRFQSQIDKGESITVTHPDITRYFMLIPEACELVLQAGAIGSDGNIFILDMGEPIKIVDLAKKMIELSGKDIDIEFTGLRAGEKLYEELLIDESDAHTQYDSITVAMPTKYNIDKLNQDIQDLLEHIKPEVKLQEIVPEFNHNK